MKTEKINKQQQTGEWKGADINEKYSFGVPCLTFYSYHFIAHNISRLTIIRKGHMATQLLNRRNGHTAKKG
jgi:hypothetical protein